MARLAVASMLVWAACHGSDAKTSPDLSMSHGGADLAGRDLAGADLAGADLAEPQQPSGWLHTEGNQILLSTGQRFHGRGADLQDTRSCDRCTAYAPSVAELKHRVDALVDDWGANFIRLTLQSHASPYWDPNNPGGGGRTQWQTVLDDPDYVDDIVEIVDYIGARPGVYVLVSIWNDPSLDAMGWPTMQTQQEWELLASVFAQKGWVLFGVSNEPQSNFDGAMDSECWDQMKKVVDAIRAVEKSMGAPSHLISVQGTQAWARVLDYYVDHPLGENVVYETHVYDAQSEFKARFEDPQKTIPVIIGEFGPADGYMTEADCSALMPRAEAIEVPWLAWTFHQACPPNLIEEHGTAAEQCGSLSSGMPVTPTSWGTLVKNRLAKAYGAN